MSLFQIDAGREWRGGQRQAFLLTRELVKAGFPARLVVQPDSPLHEKASGAGLPVIPIRMKSEMDLSAVWKLFRAMRREKCALAHFHDAHAVSIGKAAASLAGVSLRVLSRRVDFKVKSLRKYVKGIDAVIAISEEVRRVLIQGGVPENIIDVIPSGIDFEPFRNQKDRDFLRREFGFAADDFLVGIVAHLEDHKGHRFLIEAAKIVREQAPRVRIVIVGEGSLRMELDQQAKHLHVDDIVYFLGFRDDVPRVLASLDLFVLSSHMEGLGSSLMDAMASRLPVVATQTGGIPEVVVHKETGLLVPPRDPQALAQAILKLYLDKAQAARLAQRGFEVVQEKFSAEAMARKNIAVYERLAKRKGITLGR